MANKKEYTIKFNGIEKTINDVGKLDKETKKLEGTVEDLRLDQAFKVNVQGVAIQFENISQAISELDDIAQGAAGKMQMLKQAGKENTEEYQKLAAQFQEVVTQAAELERARKYSDELKDSLSSTTRGLDLAVGAFQAVGAAMEVASGVAGLFGESEEEIQKAMNRTVQIMGVLNGVQELYNQTVKKGTLLQMANAKVNKLVASIMPAMSAGIKGATVATKAFGFALKAAGIGLITTAIALLIEYWDDLKQAVVSVFPALGKAGEFFSKTKAVLAGVGNAIIQWIINPFKTAAAVISKLFSGDFSGAMEEAKKGLKAQFDVAGNYQKAYTAVQKNEEEKRRKQAAEAASKELDYQIKMLEAKKGSDAKYSEEAKKLYEEYFNNLLSMYDKDSDEYKQALIDKENYDREFKENAEKKQKEAAEKSKKAAEDHARKLKEVNKEIAENEIAAMKDGFQKKRLELERQKLEEIKLARERGIKVNEAVKSINLKYAKLNKDLIEETQKVYKDAVEQLDKNIETSINSLIEKNLNLSSKIFKNEVDSLIKIYQDKAAELKKEGIDKFLGVGDESITIDFSKSKEQVIEFSFVLDEYASRLNSLQQRVKKSVELFGDANGQLLDNTSQLFKNMNANFDSILNDFKENGTAFVDAKNEVLRKFKQGEQTRDESKKEIAGLDELFGFNIDEMEAHFSSVQKLIKDFYVEGKDEINRHSDYLSFAPVIAILNNDLAQIKHQFEISRKEIQTTFDGQKKLAEDVRKKGIEAAQTEEERIKVRKEYNDTVAKLEKNKNDNLMALSVEYFLNAIDATERNLTLRNQIVTSLNEKYVEEFKNTYNDLIAEQDEFHNAMSLDFGSSELGNIIDFSQSVYAFREFKKDYAKNMDEIQKKRDDLNEKFKKGIIDKKTFDQTDGELALLQASFKQTFESLEKDGELSAQNIVELMSNAVNMIASTLSSLFDMQAENDLKRLDAQKEALDKENEQLQEALDEKTSIYERHNEQIQSLESELESSRGSRRQFLLDQISSEMAKREEAWSQQKAIERQQAMNEKKKAMLEEQQKAIQKKRNKQQKKIDLATATMSGALAVTNALAVKPFPLGIAMAALAGVLTATQIAIIAKTKYADGGLLQGNSHANGGIPVGNTGIEVEGNEYVINKHSTQANLPVIEMINSKRRKLNINDFVEFYNGKSVNNSVNSVNKFENGGVLPSIDTNVMKAAQAVQQDNRPIYVSVQEIETVSSHIRNVRAVAGLE